MVNMMNNPGSTIINHLFYSLSKFKKNNFIKPLVPNIYYMESGK